MSDIQPTPMVYFIQGEQSRNIKIGQSADPMKRLAVLRIANSEPLHLLALYPCDNARSIEKGLHRRFWRARVCGEWFKPDPELIAFIRTHGTSPAEMIGERENRCRRDKGVPRRVIENYPAWGDDPVEPEPPLYTVPDALTAAAYRPPRQRSPKRQSLSRYLADRGLA